MAGITRRRFLQYGAGISAALTMPWAQPSAAFAAMGGKLGKYLEQVPLPGHGIVVATPTGPNQYLFTQTQITRRLHPQLPPTPLWAYDDGSGLAGQAGSFGMAVVAQTGTPLSVSFTNDLPATYPAWIPVDTRLTPLGNQVRVMTHLHGGFVAADSDGNPAVTPDGFGPGQTQTVLYPNQSPQMPASLLWFHDHGLGATRLNVFAGLAAAYLLRDQFDTGDEPNPIGIPGGAYEVPLVIQDRQFNPDGTLLYPTSDIEGVTWIGEYFGDVMLVNGKVWPFLNVEPRLYRFRILNGCNARILNLGLGGVRMWQIGAEGGLWDRPVPVTRLVLAPAERADVLVDFRRSPGQTLVMKNSSPPKPVVTPAPSLSQVMQLRVGTTVTQPGPTTIPTSLPGRAADLPAPHHDALHHPQRDRRGHGWLVLEPQRSALRGPGDRDAHGRQRGGLGLHQHDRGHPPHAHPPGHPPGHRADAVQCRGLRGGGRSRPGRRPRRDRPDPVRHRADAAARARGARVQGHHQGQPRLLHHHPGTVRPAGGRDRAADLRAPLPHRRARGQRHDAAVHGHAAVGRVRRRWLVVSH